MMLFFTFFLFMSDLVTGQFTFEPVKFSYVLAQMARKFQISESLNSDGQQFHQYQQNEQSTLTSTQ
jgi:hypothetical protein